MFLPSVKLFFNILHQISQFVNTIFYEIFITAQNSFWAGCAVRPYGINGRSTNGRKWKGDWKSVQTRLLHEIWGNADLQGAAILHEGTDDGEGVKACGIGQAESLNLIKQNPRIGRDRLKQRMEQQGKQYAQYSTLCPLADEGLIRMNRTEGTREITKNGLYSVTGKGIRKIQYR